MLHVSYFAGVEGRNRSFGELVERYLKEVSVLKAPGSVKRDGGSIRTHLLPAFGHLTLVQVTPRELAAYKVKRRAEGAKPATVNKELQLVRHAYNVAVREWEWCRDNPMHRVSLERDHNQRDRWLTTAEENRLLAASPLWLRDLIVCALHTGMRRGEILALWFEHVNLGRNTLMVMKSKNYERRTIPLNQTAIELLKKKQTAAGRINGLVFSTKSEGALDGANVSHAFNEARQRAGLQDVRFHDLRHTFATRLAQKGVDLYTIQRLLGHKTGIMTQRYAHHSPESLRGSVQLLDADQEPSVTQKMHTG